MNGLRVSLLVFLTTVGASTSVFSSCYCSEPSAPGIPGGYYAESYDMESARSEVEYYLQEVDTYKQCLVGCINEANSEAESVIDEWNSAVSAFNNR